jgi:hypothetical protein
LRQLPGIGILSMLSGCFYLFLFIGCRLPCVGRILLILL